MNYYTMAGQYANRLLGRLYTFPSTHCRSFFEAWVRGKSLSLVEIVNRIIHVYVYPKICSFFVTCLLFSRQVNQWRK